MELNNLIKTTKNEKRLGRGIGSGLGKTSGRGTKGQKSRSGGKVRIGFEGGQTPLAKRLPKLKGFKSHNPKNQAINLSDLNQFTGKITKEKLFEKGLIQDPMGLAKVLGNGKLEKAVDITVDFVSKSAEKAILAKGGKVHLLVKHQAQKQNNEIVG